MIDTARTPYLAPRLGMAMCCPRRV